MPLATRTSIKALSLAALVLLTAMGCGGRDASAGAPSGVRDSPEDAQAQAPGRFDCVPNEKGDGWDCRDRQPD